MTVIGSSLNRSEKFRLIFFLAVVFLNLLFLVKVPRISLPFSVAYLASLVLSPFIPKLCKIGLSRNVSIVIVFLTSIFFTTYPVVKFVPSLVGETRKLQYYIPEIEKFVQTNYQKIKIQIEDRTGFDIGDKFIIETIEYSRKITTSFLLNAPNIVASFFEWLLLSPLFLFFILKDGATFKRTLLRLAPNFLFERIYYLFHQFNRKLGDYIMAKMIEASIVAIVITIGLVILDIRFSLILGLVAGVTNVIPYLGPFLGSIPALILVAVEHGFDPVFGAVLILYSVANIIDIAIVFPILVSKVVDLHPVIVVVSVVIGSQYFGIAGMIISIPFAASLKLLFQEIQKSLYPQKL